MKIVGLPGSLRANSVNRQLLEAAAPLLDGSTLEIFDGIGQLPHYSEDLDLEPAPSAVTSLRHAIHDADALLIATPEYNSSLPGPLKNALDWASRPHRVSALDDKPVAIVGASPSRFGAVRAQADTRKILTSIGARVVDRELPVSQAFDAFDVGGRLADPELEARYATVLTDLARLVHATTTAVAC